MGLLGSDLARDMRAVICDMEADGLRQVLFAMIEDLKHKPSILRDRFVELALDGLSYSKYIKQLREARSAGCDSL